ncbi:MAG: hypothetical protein ACTSRW_13680 [Candidatus Helarchaeota archaeon]
MSRDPFDEIPDPPTFYEKMSFIFLVCISILIVVLIISSISVYFSGLDYSSEFQFSFGM